ncbi:hypothetical protein L195_g012747 [Trifolium pratense]|uniref:Uncharacterized protein n=1 Tax=Trifolium pratense TaxID=57577 RepID=A0A2K3PL66_TRIPR|nr:hypothetical protein L195_g012747 [Trifolium pratense]
MGETGKEEKHEETSGKGKQVVYQRVVSPYDLNSNDRPKGEKKSGRKGKMQTPANAARVEVNGGASTSITDADRAGLTGLTADQWERLVDILNKSNIDEKMTGKFESTSWIIDTGASNHLTGNLNEMCEVPDIVACPVGLPDGKRTNATKEGSFGTSVWDIPLSRSHRPYLILVKISV